MVETMSDLAGTWVRGEPTIENRNPSGTDDLIGVSAQASVAQSHEAVAAARDAQPRWAAFGGTRGASDGPREQGHTAAECSTQVTTAYSYAGDET